VASKLAKLASVRVEIALTVRKEAGRWQNLNASRCQFFRRRAEFESVANKRFNGAGILN